MELTVKQFGCHVLLPIKGIAITFANEFIGMFEDWDASFVLEGEGEEK